MIDFETQHDKVNSEVIAGQAVYSTRVLKMYDWWVLGLSNRFVWRCPTRYLERHYAEHVTGNHLDVGVGTGYFLDRCTFPQEAPRVALLDLNQNCLQAAGARIARYRPLLLSRNILEPIPFDGAPFASIGLNYVLHCLPGTIPEKAVAFDHLRPLLASDGVLFGSTILAAGVPRNLAARRLMDVYNQKQIFSNAGDALDHLRSALESRFIECRLETVGCVALFRAQGVL